MTATPRDRLLALLMSTYPELKRRLTSRLGSSDLAGEALHDTYVKLHRSEHLGEVHNVNSYLYRTIINIAKNRARADSRRAAAFKIASLLDIPDETPNPHQIAEARSELAAVEQALGTLPPRRLAIFRRAWLEGASYADIAQEFGIAERTVRHELQLITRHLHAATKEISMAELQFRLAQVSSR